MKVHPISTHRSFMLPTWDHQTLTPKMELVLDIYIYIYIYVQWCWCVHQYYIIYIICVLVGLVGGVHVK